MKHFFIRLNAVFRSAMLSVALLCGTAAAVAQTVSVKGKVLDQDGLPLPGVAALIVGTTQGAVSDENGDFIIETSPGATIEFSCLGFVSRQIEVGVADMDITVTLQPDTELLDEVVVTALGITREKKTLGYALQEVDGESLLDSRETNIANALTGKIAGVQIIRSSNGPGSSSKIQLRGNNSLTGLNQPLIVIDGTPMDNFIGADNNDFWNPSADMGNGLQDINPEDVESMSVLKGASAAALYGSRAGNGVILITTKKGKKNDGIGISVSQSVSATSTFMRPDYQTTYGQGTEGAYNGTSSYSWGEYIEGQEYTKWDGTTGNMRYYDNLENFLRTGINSTTNVTLSQQYGKTGIYASATHTSDNGVQPEASLKRTNLMLRATTTFGKDDRWSFDGKVQYIKATAHNRPISGNNDSNYSAIMYTMPTTIDIREFSSAVDENGDMFWYNTGNNPYWLTKYNQNEDTRDRFLMNASLKYKFTDWLDAEIRAGSDMYFTETTTHVYAGNSNLASGTGSYSLGESRFYENNYSFLISARKDNLFGEWGGSATFGGNLMERKSRGLSASVSPLNIEDVFSLGNGVEQASVSEDYSHRRMNSLYGTLQINYGGFVFLDGTLRNDWTSTLSPENSSFLYPSLSLSWVLSDMVNKYWAMPHWFSYAKVRASFAQVGNDMDPYQLYNVYTTDTAQNDTPTVTSGSTLYDSGVKNELITSWETGLEVRFFDNRLGLDVAWYKSNATNQLINLPLNALSGYSSKKINAGNIQNSGVEIMLNATPVMRKNFTWDTMINFSHNENKILELADGVERYTLGGYDNLYVYAQVGGDYGEIWGTKFLRVEDESSPYYGQLILDESGLPQGTNDTYKIGSQQAKANIGWTNTFNYKGFSLSFQFDARIGGQIFSGTQQMMQAAGTALVTVGSDGKRNDFVVSGVVQQSDGSYTPNTAEVSCQEYWQAVAGRSGNLGIGEANIYDATNIRLRNLSLSYSFPKKLLERSKVLQSVKLGVSMTNVVMIYSAMGGIDPESVYATSTNATGFEYGSTPTSRCFVFNVSFGF